MSYNNIALHYDSKLGLSNIVKNMEFIDKDDQPPDACCKFGESVKEGILSF